MQEQNMPELQESEPIMLKDNSIPSNENFSLKKPK